MTKGIKHDRMKWILIKDKRLIIDKYKLQTKKNLTRCIARRILYVWNCWIHRR